MVVEPVLIKNKFQYHARHNDKLFTQRQNDS
jgi:hypothetical protein